MSDETHNQGLDLSAKNVAFREMASERNLNMRKFTSSLVLSVKALRFWVPHLVVLSQMPASLPHPSLQQRPSIPRKRGSRAGKD